MSKRRIKNNFKKWLIKSIPFFLIVIFIYFNVSFFVYNSSIHKNKIITDISGTMRKASEEVSFNYVLSIPERETLKEKIEVYKIENGVYPNVLTDIQYGLKNKNWIYTKSVDRYILEYKP